MALSTGTRLGAYEIVGPLGAGGMGEVYRARDTRLGREVAVKVLPQHLADTPEIRARFMREANTISSLNHPNICTLHDVGHEGDVDFIVMELVDGETLADRVARGALPTPEALRIGGEIADALDKAHRAGIVHRDLKPGNIMLAKSGTKLLDFGLARAIGLGADPADKTHSPTMSSPLTAEGTIIGTLLYMAPEQLEGKEADARTDIWALGCVLYEMITGTRPFQGRSQASLISAIMSSEPAPIARVSPLSPPALDQLVRACLAKDPDDRIQTAHDVRLQLRWIAEGGSQAGVAAPVAARRRSRERLAWIAAAAMTIVTAGLLVAQLRPKPPAKPVIFELTPPAQAKSVDLPRISPDGRRLAFNATDSTGTPSIWVRQMNSLDAQRLPGTENATRPFWSPDSRFLAFFSGGKLRKIDVNGGPPIAICDTPRGSDGTWGSRGVILFDGTQGIDSVQSVPASGGVPSGATVIDRKNDEFYNAWPQFLPDGRHFLYISYRQGAESRTLKVGSIGSKETKSLGPADSRVEYASGYLLFVRSGSLLAQSFDAGALKVKGDPFPVAENVETGPTGSARFSASTEGTLVYRGGGSAAADRMVWTNRRGERTGTVGDPGTYLTPALSPDGAQLAVAVADPLGQTDIWLGDLARDLGTRFTTNQASFSPVWSPDGSRIAYAVTRGNVDELHVKRVGGEGTDSLLLGSNEQKRPLSWSPDGRWLAYVLRSAVGGGSRDIYGLTLDGPPRPVPLVATPFIEVEGTFAPNGKWLAFASDESGQLEIYVQPFPGTGGKWRVSNAGGAEPAWRGDSKELFYVSGDNKLMSVSVEPGSPPRFSRPQKLFDAPLGPRFPTRNRYVVARDGQRFLFVSPQDAGNAGATTVVLDWLGRLERR